MPKRQVQQAIVWITWYMCTAINGSGTICVADFGACSISQSHIEECRYVVFYLL